MRTLCIKSVRIFHKLLFVFARYFAILIYLKRLLQITLKYAIMTLNNRAIVLSRTKSAKIINAKVMTGSYEKHR